MATCLEEQLLSAYASGRMPLEEARRTRAHLDACADCRLVVDVVGATAVRRPSESWTLRPGEAVGPYEVQEWLGRGGMGSVFAAYDARLRRKVALKVLDANGVDDEDRQSALERLRREAQAMARLNHPNVAAVYDIGERDGLPYFAMELLPGGTLRGWLQAERRTPREVVRVFVAAARGLQHAHDAGLVHRDFKADNVLMAQDGTPRLTDFGLASVDGAFDVQARPRPGVICVAGTPAYFAPELLRGERATPLSDQYAFGLALRAALQTAARGGAGELARLERVLAKLIASQPAHRYPSMGAAAEALQGATERRGAWRRTAVIAAAGAAVAALLVSGLQSSAPACGDAGSRSRALLAGLEGRVRGALNALDRPGGGALSAAVVRELAGQLRRSATLAEANCRSRPVDASSRLQREATARCLTEQLAETEAWLAGLEQQPPASGAAVIRRMLDLPPPEVCAGISADEASGWAEGDRRVRGDAVSALVLRTEGKPVASAISDLDALLAATTQQGQRLVFARALALRVELEWTDPYHCPAQTLERLGQIARAAQSARHHSLAALTWNELSRCHRARGELQQGYFAAKFSQQVADALPDDAFVRHYTALTRVRRLLAVDHASESRELFVATKKEILQRFGESHPLHAISLLREADYLMNIGDRSAALAVYPRAVSQLEALLGRSSAERRAAAHNHAWALTQAFRYEEALALFEGLAQESLALEGSIRRSISSDLVPVLVALGRAEAALFHGRASLHGVSARELRVIASMGQEVNAWAEAELSFGDAAGVVERLSALRSLEGLADGGGVDDVDRRVLEARALLAIKQPRAALRLLDEAAERLAGKRSPRPRTVQALAAARIKALVTLGRASEAEVLLAALPLDDAQGIDPMRRADAWVDVALAKLGSGEVARAEQLLPYLSALGGRAAGLQARARPLWAAAAKKKNTVAATFSGRSVW